MANFALDRIWLVYNKVFTAAHAILTPNGINLGERPITLDISQEPEINAFASSNDHNDRVQINLALSELISDSPSELAFIIGHELAHIVQFRLGRSVFVSDNSELDADQMGLLFSLAAGFDPYAGAGALAKMEMASNRADLVSQRFLDHYDIHRSLNTRIAAMFDLLVAVCSDAEYRSFCGMYKSLIHPHFPDVAPLRGPAPPSREPTKE